jgi:hypothetical protein
MTPLLFVISVVLGTEERGEGPRGVGGFTPTILKEKAATTPKQTFDEKIHLNKRCTKLHH